MRTCFRLIVAVAGVVLLLPASGPASSAVTTLEVNGVPARIYRDDFGVPHVFGDTNEALFTAYGYAVAQDRLWQLELFRRAAYGTLSEILGAAGSVADLAISSPNALESDKRARTSVPGYTTTELDTLAATLTAEEREIVGSYVAGINRYLMRVQADPTGKMLPFEFHQLGLGAPQSWTIRDAIVIMAFNGRFVRSGGGERETQALLTALVARHGLDAGYAVFNDARWRNDPDTSVSVPPQEATDSRRTAQGLPAGLVLQLARAAGDDHQQVADGVSSLWRALGIPTTLGSFGWVVSAANSTRGAAMLYGGPQLDFNTPEVFHEVQLRGGSGFNVAGVAFAGWPIVAIGLNDHIAWTTMSVGGDNVDTYVETLCGGGVGYLYQGVCTPFVTRQETILVRDAAPVTITVERTIHGPVVASGPGVKYTERRSTWMREIDEFRMRLAFGRARSVNDFAAAVALTAGSSHNLYADHVGNIGYWQAGAIPVRPVGFDPRLPLPGDGSAEWTGEFAPVPYSINPQRGWLTNWNSKAAFGYDTGETMFGKQHRVLEIEEELRRRLSSGPLSESDMRAIATEISRTIVNGIGRQARFLKPYLFAALNAAPPAIPHPFLAQARTRLEQWDGSLYDDALTSTTLAEGQAIFSRWLPLVVNRVFADEMGNGTAGANTLIHSLDFHFTGRSGVPPSRDYFNGADPHTVLSNAFNDALHTFGTTSTAGWSTLPRATVTLRHPLIPGLAGAIGQMLSSNRGTYAQLVVLESPVRAETILTLGQSGFIGLEGYSPTGQPILAFDQHFQDQFGLYKNFEYKPMPLFRNWRLEP